METSKNRLHPLLTAAAVSLIVLSAVGVAALTGVLPHSRGSDAPATAPEPEKAIEHAVSMPAPEPAAQPKPKAKHVARHVTGRIESVKEIDQPGEAKGIGAVSGGVAGAVIGHNIGEHNKLVTVLGAAGGALLGNHIEKQARATRRWVITVRLDDGTTQTVASETEPAWHAGERVRLLDGKLQPA